MFDIVRYTADKAGEWNDFVAQSKNGTFLFDRHYMDYHADRFEDYSLMVLRRGKLFALLPANREHDVLFSHRGLTYGGLVVGDKAVADDVCQAMAAVNDHLHGVGIARVVYKTIPYIYLRIPSDEPLYALTEVCRARLLSRDIASVVRLDRQLKISELRRRGVRKATAHGVVWRWSDDLPAFWHLLSENLREKYDSRPVHALDEILLLHERFPDNIRLCAAYIGDEMVAGTLLYVTPFVVKTQYISASPHGKAVCALDLLFSNLIADLSGQYSYLDMGTSALDHSTELRLPLIFQKEGFGARAVCYDTYEWDVRKSMIGNE